jgi:hypothetical protein
VKNSRIHILIVLLISTAFSILNAEPDVIIFKTKTSQDVTFEEFKTGRIYFEDLKNPKKASTSKMISTISSVLLKPSGNAIVKYRNGKTDSSFKLNSYTNSCFVLTDKAGKQQSISYRNISSIKLDLDFSRSKAKQEKPDEQVKENAAGFDIDSLAKPGVVTIIQLHMPDLMASTRTWNYVKSLEENKKIKVKPIRITVGDWENPVLKKYEIKSLPQFWIYNKRGRLETKLIKRFTSTDIDEAIKKANHL